MKEFSVEEKAKRYDSMFERLKEMYNNNKTNVADRLIYERYFPELKESENERMIQYFKDLAPFDKADELYEKYGFSHKDAIAWLEKQGEHANFLDKIQVGDKVTRNEDGVLVNLSQLKRVAKKDEKQGEQKPVDTAKQEMSDEEYCSLCMDINCDGCPYVDKSKHKEQKPVEWSEEDETVRNDIIAKLATLKSRAVDGGAEKEICEMEINWLKSLKDRFTWKPSEEQIKALNYVVNLMASSERPTENDLYYNILKSLREQLKKLT